MFYTLGESWFFHRSRTKVVPFWQSESYEHLIREGEDLHCCCYYTLMNPVNLASAPAPKSGNGAAAM